MKQYTYLMHSLYRVATAGANFKPYLDQNYIPFGELVKRMKVLDAITTVETSPLDRPIKEVIIIAIRVSE
jgi:cyclophilin family peptidyl-prolyl cis-trans isomerase